MISLEGERVPFSKSVKARGNVENWLQQVEHAMTQAVKHHMKLAIKEYPVPVRSKVMFDSEDMTKLAERNGS